MVIQLLGDMVIALVDIRIPIVCSAQATHCMFPTDLYISHSDPVVDFGSDAVTHISGKFPEIFRNIKFPENSQP